MSPLAGMHGAVSIAGWFAPASILYDDAKVFVLGAPLPGQRPVSAPRLRAGGSCLYRPAGAYQGPSTTSSAGGAAASPSARRPSYRVSPMRRRRAAEASPKPPTAREAAARACLLRRPGAPRERAAPRPDRGAQDASRRGPRPRGLPAPPPHAFHHRGAHVVSRATSAARSSSPRTRASRNGPRCSAATRSSQPERAFLDRLLHHSHVIGALGEGYPPA